MLSKLVLAVAFLAFVQYAKATDVDLTEVDAEKARFGTLFTSGGNYFIALNTSQLLFWATLLGAGLLLALALSAGTNKIDDGASYGYQSQGSGYSQESSSGYSTYRQKRSSDSDLASQMYQLAMAFKKYEVKDTECQLFVACEASQLQKDPSEAGSILSEIADGVRPIMRNIGKHGRKSVQAKDEYVVKLLDAFMYGEDLARKGDQRDACEAFREKCYNQNKKPTY